MTAPSTDRLRDAAPDMLAALKTAELSIKQLVVPAASLTVEARGNPWNDVLRSIRTSIAKAEGRANG